MEDPALSGNACEISDMRLQAEPTFAIGLPSEWGKENVMKKLLFVALLLSGSVLLAQNNSTASQKDSKGNITVTGCVNRASGDYVLEKTDPGVTYELSGKKLRSYLGKRVQVTGEEEPSLNTSSDVTSRAGSPASITLRIRSIKVLDKTCSEANVNR
jgi:hypothetical protein